jgi:hypothetical protein
MLIILHDTFHRHNFSSLEMPCCQFGSKFSIMKNYHFFLLSTTNNFSEFESTLPMVSAACCPLLILQHWQFLKNKSMYPCIKMAKAFPSVIIYVIK